MRRRLTVIGGAVALLSALAYAGPIRITEQEMHRVPGGVPPGWKFTLPQGDPAKGKKVFADLECDSCHEVLGQGFPAKGSDKAGPSLAGMGAMHPAEYFAESILDPNAVIIDHPDYVGADGRSKMPSFNDSLTLAEWVDLVAYLKSLTGGDAHHAHGPEREKVVGEYRIRIDYDEPDREHRPGYFRAFIQDAETAQPVPYLPVRLRIGSGRAARTVALSPATDPAGFHYGAAVLVPDETESVTVLVGPTTMRVTPPGNRKYRTPRQAAFEW